ncbi:MAG: cation:proton antiporter [Bacteroidetes bacterium]|jgi:CPA2 family monovalent cation:H+ antiporter-2|nr:cation:proton antiporter [Bacteroidota bacterium]MCC7513834.1 cation:proton antiporter [Bacteroidia bacterium]HMU76492.1 cation:proton antiporter [Bacteroidia bacterium]HMW09229.1 cation:proton antiporter [Bacteroidia bacterium]HMX95947.1 cation:proton antiporter [Bacteroidia bacterium]
MNHLPHLIVDLALVLLAGSATILLFKRIKQPLVLGYIIAGFLVGPHFKLFPTVIDIESIDVVAELGVIFLLFGLGLEFSFKKLMRVGGSASITAFVEIAFITITGFLLGRWLKWSVIDSLFLGGMLASSSTTIIIKAFDELGVKTKQFARVVFGVLIVEDIVVILLMVLLSTIAVTQQIEGGEMVFIVLKLLFFLSLWFIMGIFLIPTLLKNAKKWLDDENLLILSIGLCLGMVVLAVEAGFSAELGAFIMGSILAETTSAEKVEHLTKPVKDLFGAVFFVSVGMMIDPQAIIDHKWAVVAVTLLTLFGKIISTSIGALISGQPLKQSLQVGFSMAQIGEFAFIVAALGASLKVTSDFLFPVAVGASAITTFTTPYLIKYTEPIYMQIEKLLPSRWVEYLNRFSSGTQKIQSATGWQSLLAAYSRIVIINGIILLALGLLLDRILIPYFNTIQVNEIVKAIAVPAISLAAGAPFIWAIVARKPNHPYYKNLWLSKKEFRTGPLLIIELTRVAMGVALITGWALYFFKPIIALVVVLPITLIIFRVFAMHLQKFYKRIEGRFITNISERESVEYHSTSASLNRKNYEVQSFLSPYNAHIVQLEVPANAAFIGKELWQLAWREKYGINIVYIRRGDKIYHIPGRNQLLLPFDEVGVLTTDEQIQVFKTVFENPIEEDAEPTSLDDIGVFQLAITEHHWLNGKSIRSSGIREKALGLVAGIERNGERILNPDSTTIFQTDDLVWLVGNVKKMKELKI